VHEPSRFEFVSRGDPVAGRLWSGPSGSARPLVLVAPALGSSQHAPEVEALCRALAEAGLAAAAFDLPLSGARESRKLSARLLGAARQRERDAADERLWAEFVRQTAADLAAAAAVLAARGGAAAGGLGLVAFEPGAEAAARWAAGEPRVRSVQCVAADAPAAEVARRLREGLLASAPADR
jgi:predicted alpha/beta-hydrolase family hydrolase